MHYVTINVQMEEDPRTKAGLEVLNIRLYEVCKNMNVHFTKKGELHMDPALDTYLTVESEVSAWHLASLIYECYRDGGRQLLEAQMGRGNVVLCNPLTCDEMPEVTIGKWKEFDKRFKTWYAVAASRFMSPDSQIDWIARKIAKHIKLPEGYCWFV